MINRATDASGLARVWREAVAGSRILSAGRFVERGVPDSPPNDGVILQRRDEALIRCDEALIQILDSSAVIRLFERAGSRALNGWRESAGARVLDRWTALALHRRIRLSAIALGAGLLVHLGLTRFSAPEPTTIARAAWIGVLVVIVLTGVMSRGLAAAWSGSTMRRRVKGELR
jgi:hypothetical protein